MARASLAPLVLCMLVGSSCLVLTNADKKMKGNAKAEKAESGRYPDSAPLKYMDVALVINKGVEAYQLKQFPQAAEYFKKAIAGCNDPVLLAAAYVNLGMCYSGMKDYKKAVESMKRSLDLQPDDFQTQLDLAHAMMLGGDFVQSKQIALALLPKIPPSSSAFVTVHTLLGNIALGTAKWGDAIEAFGKTLEANRNYVSAYIGIGEAYNHLELFEESVGALKQAVAADPANAHALFSLGKVLIKAAGKIGTNTTANLLESLHYTQKQIALAGPTTHALFNKAIALHRLGNWAAALPLFREAQWRLLAINQRRGVTAAEDELIQLIYHEGECLYRLKQYDAAADRFLRAAEERPHFAGAYQAVASSYEATGNFAAAIEAGHSAIKALQTECPSTPDLWRRTGTLRVRGRVDNPTLAGGTPKYLRGDTQPWPVYHKLVESMIKGGRPLPEIWDTMHQWRRANKKWGIRPWMTTVGNALKLVSSYDSARLPPQRYLPRPRGAVVYLCCKGAEDLENMMASIRLLHRHFLAQFPYPVIVFYGPEYLQETHMDMLRVAGSPPPGESYPAADLRFVPVNISDVLPPTDRRCNWSYRGYCEMSRFFAGALHDMPALADFDFVWRMDTDSFVLAPVDTDLFQSSANFGCAYSVATMSVEPSEVVSKLWETVEQFMQRNKTSDNNSNSWWTWMSNPVSQTDSSASKPAASTRPCPPGLTCLARSTSSSETAEGHGTDPKKVVGVGLEKALEGGKAWMTETESVEDALAPIDDLFEFHKTGGHERVLNTIMMTHGKANKPVWNRLHFYNNFEISRLSFWRSPQYREYFDYIDKAGGIFEHRWGDSPVKSLAALLLLRDDQFCYVGDQITYMHQSWLPITIPSAKTPEGGGAGSWARGLDVAIRRKEAQTQQMGIAGSHQADHSGDHDGFALPDIESPDYNTLSFPKFSGGGLGDEGLEIDFDVKCETCGRDTG